MVRRFLKFFMCLMMMVIGILACTTTPKFEFPQDTRVGIINLLESHATHKNISSFATENFTKSYQVDWDIPSYAENLLITQLEMDNPFAYSNYVTGTTGLKALTAFKNQLEEVKIRVNKEIGNYPSPIPACDVQFNYLLEERAKISVVLKRVESLLATCQTKTIATETIEELIKMSSQIDDGMAARLRAAISRTNYKIK